MIKKGEYHPDQYQEYLRNHYPRNMAVNILDVGFFQFAMAIISVAVVMPAFAVKLGASNLLIGFLPAVIQIGWFLPQLISSFFIEGLVRKKPLLLLSGIFQRLPWIVVAVSTFYLAASNPAAALAVFFFCFAVTSFSGGFTATAWGELIAKAIPEKMRGTFMGLIQLLGSILAVLGGFIVKYVMEGGRFSFPLNYTILFSAASILLFISFFFFSLNREPIVITHRKSENLKSYLKWLPVILKTDRNFLHFIISRILGHSNIMGVAFFMAFALKNFNLKDTISGNFVIASTAATVLCSPVLGKAADRIGHKIILVFSSLAYLAAVIFALIAWHWYVMYLVFIFMAVSIVCFMISMQNIVFEFSPQDQRPTYLGLAGTLSAPFIIFFSFLGGKLADLTDIGYKLPFTVSLLLNAVSLIILVFFVSDPRKKKQNLFILEKS
ncbi:MAG: MFS transporter [bacterium]